MSPIIRPLFTVATIEDRAVVSAEIIETDIFDKPCFYTGTGRLRGSYLRVGEADIQMTEYEVYSYEAFKRKIYDELRIIEIATRDTLNEELLTEYLPKLKREKPNLANLEIENPGRLTIDKLGTAAADTRNPFIASVMEIMLKTENRFSGIPTIITAMKEETLPPPIFESSRGVFKVILYNSNEKETIKIANEKHTEAFEEKIKEFCKIPRSQEEIAKELNLSSIYYMMTKYIYPLVESNILQMTMPNSPRSKNQRYVSK